MTDGGGDTTPPPQKAAAAATAATPPAQHAFRGLTPQPGRPRLASASGFARHRTSTAPAPEVTVASSALAVEQRHMAPAHPLPPPPAAEEEEAGGSGKPQASCDTKTFAQSWHVVAVTKQQS
eukprot:TRINITY_DN4440_c0_g2_i2.p3 TRINITY_DN4440_c0_g2~~TRINITY_DN4440_c0_g2_i2.p3  ORF type:complete len:122 (-),score=38.88 TRINITY_DN4440_c0_g2_i2:30-395(-)